MIGSKMDLSGQQQKSQAESKCKYRHHFLKKASQFFVSFSALSFRLSYDSAFIFFFLCFNFHFSTLLFSLFSHTIERKYVFLICNVLAFLVKLSTSNDSPPTRSYINGDLEKRMEGGAKPVPQLHKLGDKKANTQSVGNDGDEDVKESEARGLIPASTAEDEGKEVDFCTDELNRKFDEFIRRMKEEIRKEPQWS